MENQSYDSVTVGLIHSIRNIARAIRQRPLKSEGARRALSELADDPDVKALVSGGTPSPSSPPPSSPLEPPLTPTHTPPSTGGYYASAPVRARAKEPQLFKTSESLPTSVEDVVTFWNGFFSLTRINTLGKRIRFIQKALQNEFWAENWKAGIEKVATNKFCNGENKRHWKADIEWICDPVNLDKLLAGKYDNLDPKSQPPDYAREEI